MTITECSTAVPLLIWMAESDTGKQIVAITNEDDSRRAQSDEGAKYYTEKYIRPGKLVRQCIVSEDCPNKNWHYEKRIDMVRHLKKVHNIDFNIPRLPMGRPRSGHLALALPPTTQLATRKKQFTEICRKRFEDVELKVKNARKKFLAGLNTRAAAAWENYKKNDLSEEEFRKKFIEDKMNEWEEKMPRRIEAIKRRIEKGYDKMKRSKDELVPTVKEDKIELKVLEDKVEPKVQEDKDELEVQEDKVELKVKEARKQQSEDGEDKIERKVKKARKQLAEDQIEDKVKEARKQRAEDQIEGKVKEAGKRRAKDQIECKAKEARKRRADNKVERKVKEARKRRADNKIEHKVEQARRRFHAGLPAKASAAWEDYMQDDLSEEEFRKKFIEDKINEWEALLPQRIEAIKQRMDKSCYKRKPVKHDVDPNLEFSESSEDTTGGVPPNGGVTLALEYKIEKDESHTQTRNVNNITEKVIKGDRHLDEDRIVSEASDNSVQDDQPSAEASMALRCAGERNQHISKVNEAHCRPNADIRKENINNGNCKKRRKNKLQIRRKAMDMS